MPKQFKMLTGSERLKYNGVDLPFSILNYWQLNLSVLLLNVNRGGFAEYLVSCALSEVMEDALIQVKTGMEAWDVDGPEIVLPDGIRSSRIEVKSTASVQIDTPDEKEPIALPANRLVFSIRKAVDYSGSVFEARRNNDLYVFAHYKATRKSDNILDLNLWDFYVYPTFMIDENPSLAKQKTLSIKRLQMLGVKSHGFETLCQAILETQKQISDHFMNRQG
ncbi:MAG: hypothetical protein IJV51_00035 [Oscillospiraceae bacterium]|nr:hypothetical protein [Oscillospiraceae bacterium]